MLQNQKKDIESKCIIILMKEMKEVKGAINELQGEMKEVKGAINELQGAINELQGEMKSDKKELKDLIQSLIDKNEK